VCDEFVVGVVGPLVRCGEADSKSPVVCFAHRPHDAGGVVTPRQEAVLYAGIVVFFGLLLFGSLMCARTQDEPAARPTHPTLQLPNLETSPPNPSFGDWPRWPSDRSKRTMATLIAYGWELEAEPPTTTPRAVPESWLRDLVCSYDWDCGTAMRVAWCESSYRPDVISPTNDYGLMQVNRRAHSGRVAAMGYTWDDLLSPGPNLEVAWAIYAEAGGWGPWRYSQHCWGGAR
jgi:hypothetical protein